MLIYNCLCIIVCCLCGIESNYFNNFLIENGGSKENIFTIVEDGTVNNERDQYSCKNKLRISYLSKHVGTL